MATYGKEFSDVYNESARDTGDTTTGHITYVKKKVNDAGREIYNEMGFKFKERAADVTLVASTQYLTMSDIASDWDEDTPVEIYYRNTANQRSNLDCYDDNEWADEEDLDEGNVFGFHIAKISGVWRVYFVLVPDASFVSDYSPMKIEYLSKWVELSGDTDIPGIPTQHHQGLVYWTNKLICAEQGDIEGFALWEKLADRALGLMKKRQVHRTGRPKRVYPRAAITLTGRAYRPKDYNL